MADSMRVTKETATRAAPSTLPVVDRKRFFRLLALVMLPMFLAAVDQTMLATAMPVISREFASLRDSSWLAVSYLVASIIVVPLYGQLGDQHGRRSMLLVAMSVFLVGSLCCGLAPTLGALVASRVVQGFGGGGLLTLSQALIGEVVPPRERSRYQGYFVAVFSLASVGGPVLSGLVVEHASWRWLFLGNIPLGLIALWRLLATRHEDQKHPRPGRIHYKGIVLFAAAVTLSLFWLSSAGHRFAWLSPASGVALAVAIALWVLLVAAERRHVRPFLPVDLLHIKTVRSSVFTVVAFASVMFSIVFYLPMYFQILLQSSVSESGLLLLPITAGIVSGAGLTGRIVVWTGRARIVPVLGLLLSAACLVGITFASADRTLLSALGYFTGMGLGTVMSIMQIMTQIAAGPARLGAAAATLGLSRSFGAAIGATAFGALIFTLIDADNALQAAADPAMRAQVGSAFHIAFLCAAGVCVLASWLASRVPDLRRETELTDLPPVSQLADTP